MLEGVKYPISTLKTQTIIDFSHLQRVTTKLLVKVKIKMTLQPKSKGINHKVYNKVFVN